MNELWSSIIQVASGVSTLVALAAIVAALLAMVVIYIFVQHTRTQVKLLERLPAKDRAAQLPAILRGLPFTPEALSEKSQTQLTLLVLKHSFWLKVVFVGAALAIVLGLALLAVRQPPLPWQAAAFEVQDHSVTWDLSTWSQATPESKEITKAHNRLSVVKVRADVEHFTARIGTTSKVDPTITDASLPWRMVPITDTGVNSARTWQVAFHIADFQPMNEFPIAYAVTYRNAFQGPSLEWAAFTTIHPTRQLRLSVKFPQDKPMKSLQIYSYPRNDRNKKASGDKAQLTKHSPEEVEWTIPFPRLNWNYVLEWAW
jgi:hypothetical protein